MQSIAPRGLAAIHRIIESLGPLPTLESRPTLVLISGLPGTGKSHFSRALAQKTGLALVQSDVVRKLIFPRPTYSPTESYILFMRCHEVIQHLLECGISIIFDATNLREKNRKYLYRIADQVGAKLVIVGVEAPPEVVAQRLARRAAGLDSDDLSDATWEVYEQMASTTQRIRRDHYVVDTSKDIGPVLFQLTNELKGHSYIGPEGRENGV